MDTRKAEDPRTLAIASKIHEQMPAWIATGSTSVFAVVGMLHDIWSRCMELETETLTASPEQLEEWYGYPKGFIKAMEQVGWAKVGKGSVTIHTRNQQAQEQRRMREERARRVVSPRLLSVLLPGLLPFCLRLLGVRSEEHTSELQSLTNLRGPSSDLDPHGHPEGGGPSDPRHSVQNPRTDAGVDRHR